MIWRCAVRCGLLLLPLVAAVAGGRESPWFIDAAYSRHLLGSAQLYELRAKQDSADTVDVLQIFRTTADDAALFDVADIRSKDWVYETSSKEFIATFFSAARESSPEECVTSRAKQVLHVLAFDRELMRVGYLKYYRCPDGNLGALAPYGTSALYFSHVLAALLEPMADNGPSGVR